MSLFNSLRKRRRKSAAEIKAAKKRAAKEVASRHRGAKRREKLLARQEKKLIKAENKGLKAKRKHEKQMADRKLAQIKNGRFNKDQVKRWTGAARLLTPLLIPLAYQAVTSGREKADEFRARRLGVSAEELSRHTGHGAALKARIEGVRHTISESEVSSGYLHDAEARLDELANAVDNAEYMTPEQRRRAHSAIGRDIDGLITQIHQKLMRTPGGNTQGGNATPRSTRAPHGNTAVPAGRR